MAGEEDALAGELGGGGECEGGVVGSHGEVQVGEGSVGGVPCGDVDAGCGAVGSGADVDELLCDGRCWRGVEFGCGQGCGGGGEEAAAGHEAEGSSGAVWSSLLRVHGSYDCEVRGTGYEVFERVRGWSGAVSFGR